VCNNQVAALAIRALNNDKTIQKVLTAIDPSLKSEYNTREAPVFEL
jgi:hypothetical protein